MHFAVSPLGGTNEQVTNDKPDKGITSLLMSLTLGAAYQHSISTKYPVQTLF